MVFNRKHDPNQPDVRMADGSRPSWVQGSAPIGAPREAETGLTESVIGNDLSIEGQTITIRCKGTLKVHGNIQADLHSRRLEVGKEAVINGAIAADAVDVFGRVQGAILGARVVLHSGSDVEGDIMSGLLSVEEGANFDGRSRRVTNPAEIAPQLDPAATSVAEASAGAGLARRAVA